MVHTKIIRSPNLGIAVIGNCHKKVVNHVVLFMASMWAWYQYIRAWPKILIYPTGGPISAPVWLLNIWPQQLLYTGLYTSIVIAHSQFYLCHMCPCEGQFFHLVSVSWHHRHQRCLLWHYQTSSWFCLGRRGVGCTTYYHDSWYSYLAVISLTHYAR